MELKCVGDIMTPLEAFPYIPYWFTLRQALAEWEDTWLKSPDHKSIPWLILVFSARNQLLGAVRHRDILPGLKTSLMPDRLRDHYSKASDEGVDLNLFRLSFTPQKASQELTKQFERQIIEFMIPIQETVDYEDHALIALYLMIDQGLTFVPVVKDEQVAGLVYAEDVLHEVITNIL